MRIKTSESLRHSHSWLHWALPTLAVVLALALAPAAWAQAQYATITGVVRDPSNALVPAAKVVLTNEATTTTRSTTTDAKGFFSFSTVPQGTYSVTVSHAGFKTLHQNHLVVNAGAQIGLTGLTLALGTSSQTVEVSSQAYYTVPTTTGAKIETITNQQVENMPLESRSVVQSVLILPGVVNSNPTSSVGAVTGWNGNSGGVGGFEVNGGRNDEVAITSNGTNNIDPGNLGGADAIPNKEMVSEVTVQTANYSASNPQGPVVINTVTKNGTSQFHGEAYYTLRRPGWNANDWLNNQSGLGRSNSRFNYPGFNIGGPILVPGTNFNHDHNKAFFFFGAEWMRQVQDLGVHDGSVPTALMRQGNFTELTDPTSSYGQFWPSFSSQTGSAPCQTGTETYALANGTKVGCSAPGVINFGAAGSATAIDPGAAAFFKQMPLPNHTPTKEVPFNYVSDATGPVDHNQYTGRVDYDFTENTKLYVTLDHESEKAVDPYGLWWGGSTIPYPGQETAQQHVNQSTATLVQVLSPTLTNEINVGVTRVVLPWGLADPSLDSTSSLGYPYNGVFPNTTGMMPSLENWDNGFPTLINGEGSTIPTTYANKWLNQIKDDFSLVAGNHLLKFGMYFEHVTNVQPTSDPRGNITEATWGGVSNNSYANLELGNINSFSQSNTLILPELAYNELDGYIEDEWHAMPRLTLTYGLRVDHMGWAYDNQGHITDWSGPAYINGGGYICGNPGIYGCGSLAGQNPYSGGTAPLTNYPGLLRASNSSAVPLSGMPSPGPRFAPNFGWAYDLTGHASSIIRGGIGVFFYRDQFNLQTGAVADPPVASSVSVGGSGLYLANLNASFLPNCSLPGSISNGACIPNISVLSATDNRTPYTVSYSLTLSQKLPLQTVFEASYVGNVSRNQILPGGSGNGGFNSNLIPEGTESPMWLQACGGTYVGCTNPTEPSGLNGDQPFRPFANYGTIDLITHSVYQDYNSLQVTATRTTPHLMYSFAYTFSKALGVSGMYNGSGFPVDPFAFRQRSYGPIPFDHTNVLAAQYNVVLPDFGTRLFGGNGIANEALNGWQITGITFLQQGAPIIDSQQNAGAGTSITMNSKLDFNANFITGTPDTTVHPILVSGCNPTANLKPGQVFNAMCFESPAPGQNGEYQIPYIHGPGLVDTDLGLFKSFAIGKGETRKIQVRAEAFNVFNHPNGTLAVNGTESPALQLPISGFLQSPTLSSDSRVGYVQSWTGHRELALTMKFIF